MNAVASEGDCLDEDPAVIEKILSHLQGKLTEAPAGLLDPEVSLDPTGPCRPCGPQIFPDRTFLLV